MTQLQKTISGTTYPISYAYNLAGEPNSITYPSSRVVQPSYDAVGRLCAVGASGSTCSTGTTYATGFVYNTAQQVTGFNYGNGVAASLGYSSDRLQLTSLSYVKGATTLLSLGYSYGAAGSNDGQISGITDSVDNGRSATYSYDALYRLTSAVTTGSTNYQQWGLSFTYDRYGNRTAQSVTAGTGPSNSVTIDPTTNRISGAPYAYDANGNMTNDGLNTLTYDAENHAVTAAGYAYLYDGNGLRVQKCTPNCTSPTTSTVYTFSGSKVVAEYDNGAAPGSPSREYVYSGGALLVKFEGSATTYYHPDHLSNRVLTDSSGNSAGTSGHYPFGESWYASGTSTKLKFTSYERDAETGNDFAMARYHVNRLGRFSSPDPIAGSAGDPQSLNRYAYVGSDPVNGVDPSGLLGLGVCAIDGSCLWPDSGGADAAIALFNSLNGWNSLSVLALAFTPTGEGPGQRVQGTEDETYNPPMYGNLGLLGALSVLDPFGGGVDNRWGKTFPCKHTSAQAAAYLTANFAVLASTTVTNGPVDNIVSFTTPDGIAPGNQVNTNVTTVVGGTFVFQVPTARAQLTVKSTSESGFVLQTDPAKSPLNGTLTFSATPAANGQVSFSVQAQGSYTSTSANILAPLGKTLENGIWNHLVEQIRLYCK